MVLMAVVIQEQGSAGNPFETHDKSFMLRLQTQTFSWIKIIWRYCNLTSPYPPQPKIILYTNVSVNGTMNLVLTLIGLN